PASASRNFAGSVSRPLSSSFGVWVPRNTGFHLPPISTRTRKSSEIGYGASLPPHRAPRYPTFHHSQRQNDHFSGILVASSHVRAGVRRWWVSRGVTTTKPRKHRFAHVEHGDHERDTPENAHRWGPVGMTGSGGRPNRTRETPLGHAQPPRPPSAGDASTQHTVDPDATPRERMVISPT